MSGMRSRSDSSTSYGRLRGRFSPCAHAVRSALGSASIQPQRQNSCRLSYVSWCSEPSQERRSWEQRPLQRAASPALHLSAQSYAPLLASACPGTAWPAEQGVLLATLKEAPMSSRDVAHPSRTPCSAWPRGAWAGGGEQPVVHKVLSYDVELSAVQQAAAAQRLA